MDKTVLQIPIETALKNKASKAANEQGFSSIQEAVRIFLNQLAKRQIEVGFSNPPIKLSDKNDERYAKMINDVKTGKVKTKSLSNTDELISYLNS